MVVVEKRSYEIGSVMSDNHSLSIPQTLNSKLLPLLTVSNSVDFSLGIDPDVGVMVGTN